MSTGHVHPQVLTRWQQALLVFVVGLVIGLVVLLLSLDAMRGQTDAERDAEQRARIDEQTSETCAEAGLIC